MQKYKAAFLAAFPLTLPICAAFLFLGLSYGFYICSKGFSPWYPFFTSMLVFAGSMEFVLVGMLLGTFNPLYCYLVTLMVNSRHLFYGLSMLEKFAGTGWKKFYLIFSMCDESFAINVSTSAPEGVDQGGRSAIIIRYLIMQRNFYREDLSFFRNHSNLHGSVSFSILAILAIKSI